MSFFRKRPFLFALLGAAALVGALATMRIGMDTLLRQDAWFNGMELAAYIEAEVEDLDLLLSGEATPETAETLLSQLATIGNIYRFEFYNADGELAFATGTYHPPTDGMESEHHAHLHESVPMPLPAAAFELRLGKQDPNQATVLGNAAALDADGAMHGAEEPANDDHDHGAAGEEHNHGAVTDEHEHGAPTGEHADHDPILAQAANIDPAHARLHSGHHVTELMYGDGETEPPVFAEIIHPMADENGELRGIIRLLVDQTERYTVFTAVLYGSAATVLVLFLIGVGIPLRSHMRTLRAKKEADERIHYLAQHDPLTDLPNRNSFVASLADTMKDDHANGRLTAVHFVDIDLFKQLNDTLGHDVGDAALVAAAQRLTELKGGSDYAARLGGDEFALIQPGLDNPEQADEMAASIVAAFSEAKALQGHLVKSTASVGTALAPTDGDNMSRLMKSADIALYQAKAGGRNTARRFETWMDDKLAERRNIEVLLQDAISGNRLEVYYQPLFDRTGNTLQGFEALARLRDHSGSFVPPTLFIPVAEKMGLISEIGEWVIGTACSFAAQWPDEIKLAINLSAEQFRGRDIVATVEAALQRAGITGDRLEFEITESMLMADTEDVLKTLTKLKALGASVVMDDFGTGYSSLGYLWKFPFDKVKIDRSFVERFESNPDKIDKIVATIVTLSHSMGMSVTAEGVETDGQAEWLRSLNCDQLQGFLFGRPTPATEASSFILKSVQPRPHHADDPHNYPQRSTGTV